MKKSIIYYWILKFCNNKIKILNNLHRKYAEVICKNGGDILEIGFGMGISATHIQSYDINSHTSIEII